MLNKIILSLIKHQPELQIKAMSTDAFENPATYKGWIYSLRYLLSLRYLKIKQQVLKNFRSQKIYPIQDSEYKLALIEHLSDKTDKHLIDRKIKDPITAFGFKSKIIYPITLIVLAIGIFGINQWHQQRKIENIFANHLPYFSDLLHRKLILHHNDQQQALGKIETSIEKEEETGCLVSREPYLLYFWRN